MLMLLMLILLLMYFYHDQIIFRSRAAHIGKVEMKTHNLCFSIQNDKKTTQS